ncbi:hypothetical protein F5J12DRAFT_782011 [Pisolithus orientalis]|uniref:uncharacterized protein n=1 Tax=Pisolithus orientalis TaxID=936130 RepID=UPI0022240376|nr:uncharacterized protein F5J12DRAFT_782011 [Pisolithus orientalis]KAI6009476.1 hypothetical protein F5J12DRAFT_782011 [Pisolithus orientalis]
MLSFPSISCWLKDKAHPKVLSLKGNALLELGLPKLIGMDVQPPDSLTLVDDRLQATSTMIVTKGKDIDVLEKHQGHQAAPSHWSLSQVLCQCILMTADHKFTRKPVALQTGIGWPVMSPELAGKASPYAKMFFMNDDTRLFTDKAIIQWKNNICMHITDRSAFASFSCMSMTQINQHLKDFHINFWYTAELTPMKVGAAKDIHTTPLQMCALTAVAVPSIHPYMMHTTTLFSKQLRTPLSAWQLITICCGFINADSIPIVHRTTLHEESASGSASQARPSSSASWSMGVKGYKPFSYDYTYEM